MEPWPMTPTALCCPLPQKHSVVPPDEFPVPEIPVPARFYVGLNVSRQISNIRKVKTIGPMRSTPA